MSAEEVEILKMVGRSLDARFAAEDGEFCQCAEPEHPNDDGLMCRRCFRENRSRREAKERRMAGPHEFVLFERAAELRMCAVCSGWEDDARHTPPDTSSGEGDG